VSALVNETSHQAPGKKLRSVRFEYSLAGFERFCQLLNTEDGSVLEVEPFQRRVLRDHFAGAVEEVVILPKKNGKSTLFSALALYHLENWPESEVDIGASSRDQATILFNQAAAMVARSRLEDRFDVKGGYRHIRLRSGATGKMRVLAADAKTADGVIPTLALVDELHRHPSGELYGVLRDGLDGRDGRMVTMSTAGLSEESPLGLLREKAQKLPSFRRRGAYSTARSPDGSFVLHEWSLESGDNFEDLRLVKKANPASWQTVEKLRRRLESPSMTPGRWARFACGVWTGGEEPWLEAAKWDRLRIDIGRVEPGERVWVAILAGTNPAVVMAAPRADDAVAVAASIYEGAVPLERLEAELLRLAESYDIAEVAFDRVGFQRSAELLEEQGLTMVEIPHSPERLSIVSMTLHRLIEAGKLGHDGDSALRGQVLAGQTKETERGWRLIISNETKALIAMAVAAHQATQVLDDPGPQLY